MSQQTPPANEPVLSYAPGSPERAALVAELDRQSTSSVNVPLVVGDQSILTEHALPIRAPHEHGLVLGLHAVAAEEHVTAAIEAASAARRDWAAWPLEQRLAVYERAADLLAGPWRQRLNAATVLGQSKTAHQAEIDAACELTDFFRFNVHFARQLSALQPLSSDTELNRLEPRPLDGFVYAVTPFNFTAIAGNLPTAPTLFGNTVVWKPSPHAVLSAHHVMELLRAAGLPPGVINLVFGDAGTVTRRVLGDARFGGLHFTGSSSVLRAIWQGIAERLPDYAGFPRIVGETGGKGFIVAHPSADLDALAVAMLRGGFEYQGQKCSAASRAYVPRSLWPALEQRLTALLGEVRVGSPRDFGNFMAAVIARPAFDKITGYIELARRDPSCRLVFGGGARAEPGFFIEPTLIEVRDPKHRLLAEEIFGPVVAVLAYDDDRFEEVLEACDTASGYALTGAVFARDRSAIELASRRLLSAAGNFYVNDKPTGAVVGRQPFGGGRLSGTNDKAGSILNLTRWMSPRIVKENLAPPTEWRYPFMNEA